MKKLISSHVLVLFALLAAWFVMPRTADAAASIQFNATEVQMFAGQGTKIAGTLTNYGDMGATVNVAQLSVQVTDVNGNPIWSDFGTFNNVNVYVAPGATLRHAFNLRNLSCPSYTGEFRWHVSTDLSFG